MSRLIDEQLSALLDGELPAEQETLLLRRLDGDPGLRETLARYGMIGELLRDASAPVSALDVSVRVSAAVATEGAPATATAGTGYSSSSNRLGYVGAGIAASIAMLVMFNLSDTGSTMRQAAIASVVQPEPVLHAHGHDMAVEPERLTRYLVAHAQYTNSTSRQLFDSHLAMAVSTGTNR